MKQLIVTILVCSGFYSIAQQDSIYIIGAMKDVMWKGDLKGRILLDSISPKLHAYGLGPLENLKGEIMLLDGKCFVSKYETDSTVAVIEDCNVKAPFFGYTNISSWSKSNIPDSVCNISQIDAFLETTVAKNNQPFFFN
jgi:acetolactate decarboxylase